MVWAGRDLKDHLVPTPCHKQGHLPLDQVAQSIHSFSGQPVPVFHHPHGEEFLPNS